MSKYKKWAALFDKGNMHKRMGWSPDVLENLRCPICKVVTCDHRDSVKALQAELDMLRQRIADAVNVAGWAGGVDAKSLGHRVSVMDAILRGVVDIRELRMEGFDLEALRSEREILEQENKQIPIIRSALGCGPGENTVERAVVVMEELKETKARLKELEDMWAEHMDGF